jgi:hypothetical protein
MNPEQIKLLLEAAIHAALPQVPAVLEDAAISLAVDCATSFIADVMSGKAVAQAASDMSMTLAEKQAQALEDALFPKT